MAKRRHLFLEARKPWRRGASSKEFLRLGLEGDQGRRQAKPARSICELVENRPVTEMYAIEVANGHGRATMPGSYVVQTAD